VPAGSSYRRLVILYAVVSEEIEQVIEFFRTPAEAEAMLSTVLEDEPDWKRRAVHRTGRACDRRTELADSEHAADHGFTPAGPCPRASSYAPSSLGCLGEKPRALWLTAREEVGGRSSAPQRRSPPTRFPFSATRICCSKSRLINLAALPVFPHVLGVGQLFLKKGGEQ
jgi:hypothetical protein